MSANPLLRPKTPFERRLLNAVDAAKPNHGVGIFSRPLPGGVSQAFRKTRASNLLNPTPFMITGAGKIMPGLVGSRIPTLDGGRLDITDNKLDLTASGGNFLVFFKITFSVTYLTGFLSSYSLTDVIVDTGSSLPSSTASVKYLQFNTVTSGKPSISFFNTSISVALCDNGVSATSLSYSH